MKLISKTAARALLLALCGMSAAIATRASTYTWRGTNDATWGNANNWLAKSIAPTNGTYIHRLEVNNAGFAPMTYDAGEGTTTYGTAGVRGLVVGSGANGSGTMNITGGKFITANGSTGDVVGNSDNSVGILNITGGTVRARANSAAFIPLLTQVNIRKGGGDL